jgi:hypothetical protein
MVLFSDPTISIPKVYLSGLQIAECFGPVIVGRHEEFPADAIRLGCIPFFVLILNTALEFPPVDEVHSTSPKAKDVPWRSHLLRDPLALQPYPDLASDPAIRHSRLGREAAMTSIPLGSGREGSCEREGMKGGEPIEAALGWEYAPFALPFISCPADRRSTRWSRQAEFPPARGAWCSSSFPREPSA